MWIDGRDIDGAGFGVGEKIPWVRCSAGKDLRVGGAADQHCQYRVLHMALVSSSRALSTSLCGFETVRYRGQMMAMRDT